MDLCGKRLLTRKDAGVPEAIVEGDPITFNTANGPYKAKKQALIDVFIGAFVGLSLIHI